MLHNLMKNPGRRMASNNPEGMETHKGNLFQAGLRIIAAGPMANPDGEEGAATIVRIADRLLISKVSKTFKVSRKNLGENIRVFFFIHPIKERGV